MHSLVMSLFSRDYIKMKLKYQQCFITYLKCVQYSLSAWFLDGRTSTCFFFYIGTQEKIAVWLHETKYLLQFRKVLMFYRLKPSTVLHDYVVLEQILIHADLPSHTH